MVKRIFDKNFSAKHLQDLVVLCAGVALLITVAVLLSDSAGHPAQGSATSRTAAIGYALNQVSGMKSFGSAAGPNAQTQATNSDTGWPAPLGCSFGSNYETCVQNNSNNIFGVFAGKNTADTVNLGKGTITYFKAEPTGGDLDGFRMFWSPPTITHTRVQTCFSGTNCVVPPVLTGDDLRRDFNGAFHIEDSGDEAPNKVAGNESTFNGGSWLITKANLYSSKNKEATGKQFQDVSATTKTYSIGNDVVIPVGGSARLEWVCQPYQINYWDAFCGSLNNSKCINARILDLFDQVVTNIPGVNSSTINGAATVSPTANTTYTLKCRSVGRSGGPVTYGVAPTSPSSPVEGPYRFSYTTATQDGPLMSVTVKIAGAPTSRIQANSAAYNTNIEVAAGTPVVLHANFTLDPDDVIIDSRIVRDGSTVVYTQTSSSADITAPSFAAAAGTAYTYSPQVRTLGYPAWRNSGGSVKVTVEGSDTCPNVPGVQVTTPCADATCVAGGGTWNGSACVADTCPNVPGAQTTTPCADATCVAGGGTWNSATGICTPAASDTCPNVPGVQTTTPCADATCVAGGGTWNGSACVADTCPNVPGAQTSTPCADTVCVAGGGTWNGTSCITPPTTTLQTFLADPSRVRSSEKTTLSWQIQGPITGCTITANPDSTVFPYAITVGNGSVESDPITQTTIFTLSCGAAGSLQKTITVIPQFQEL